MNLFTSYHHYVAFLTLFFYADLNYWRFLRFLHKYILKFLSFRCLKSVHLRGCWVVDLEEEKSEGTLYFFLLLSTALFLSPFTHLILVCSITPSIYLTFCPSLHLSLILSAHLSLSHMSSTSTAHSYVSIPQFHQQNNFILFFFSFLVLLKSGH